MSQAPPTIRRLHHDHTKPMETTIVQNANTVDYRKNGPDLFAAMEGVEEVIARRGIEPRLHHLILLRASQINKCAFCVKMHARDARKAGETENRLDRLIVWRHVDDFSPREKAAFAWTEALTELEPDADRSALRDALHEYFSDAEITTLTAMVAMINLWNRIQVSNH